MRNPILMKAMRKSLKIQTGDFLLLSLSKSFYDCVRLARNLFYRLMKVEPVERYNASQALAHPWVCRDKEA